MKAFLSHSSKDKYFVGQVAAALGTLQVEYDEQTFDLTLNVQAIRRALSRSDLFVVFLSANSIGSPFVAEEQRSALEARGRGFLKKVLIFAIDNTSYRALPEWLREINIVQQLSSPKTCARRIQSALIQLDAEQYRESGIYLGREDDEKQLRRALSAPATDAPVAVHAVGHLGIGRRTFLRKSLSSVYPRLFEAFVEISFGQYQGIEEFFRALHDLHVVASLSDTIAAFDQFSKNAYPAQISRLVDIVSELTANGELIIVIDDGGVYNDQGDYQPFFKDLITSLNQFSRPALCFVQSRMMPFTRRQNYPRSYHAYLRPLTDTDAYQNVKNELNRYTTVVAKRVSYFLECFYFRLRGDLDRSEEMHLKAWALSRDNLHINRELASVYCKQHRYNDAEIHARAAYNIAPTNPFLIDILAETLLGKTQMGFVIDQKELERVLRELSIYGDAPGSSFFLIRDAQRKARDRDCSGALKLLDRAVERTPTLLSPYFIRADVRLRIKDLPGAECDLREINRRLTDAGGFSEGDEALQQELEIRILIEKKQFKPARDKVKRAAFLPDHVAKRLSRELARSIAFSPEAADRDLLEWAKTV